MSEVQGIIYVAKISNCTVTAQLSCFGICKAGFPYDVAQMHHMQIRDLRVSHSSPLCLLIDVYTILLKINILRQK